MATNTELQRREVPTKTICQLATNMNRVTKERGANKDNLSVGYQHEQREVHTKTVCQLATNTNRVTKERGTHKDDLSVELQRWDI